ncbi:MAG TPA: hypothetical protein VJN18_35145 [Polyangiaceae bacterium]|nr:hypothetical protein [Polyangiaceae bacterium]
MMKTDISRTIAGFSVRTKKKTVGIVAKIGAIVGALALVSSPAAADDMTFPGSMCVLYTDNWTFDLERNGTELFNDASNSVHVNCPVPREAPASATTIYAYFRINNLAGQTTSCTFYASNQAGSQVDSESRSSVGAGTQYLEFYNISSASWGGFAAVCNLGADSWIYNYYLSE